ncbi:MAG: hypothetical protein AAGD22_17525, partial [Verrucomicrobiota bacterium]
EHRIQIAEEHQTHRVPSKPAAKRKLAASLGYHSITKFEAELATVSHSVRSLFETHFTLHPPDKPHPTPDLSFFESPEDANRSLRALGEEAGVSPRTRRVFRRFRPNLLDRLQSTVEPDVVLTRLLRFVENYGIRATLFELLVQHPGLLDWLCRLFDSSAFASEIAIGHPELAEEVAQGTVLDQRLTRTQYLNAFEITLTENPDLAPADCLRLFRAKETLRIALRDVLSIATIEDVLIEYTALAEACLSACLAVVLPTAEPPLTVIALGKFGASELSYGSDLDIVFVGDNGPAAHALTAEFGRYSANGPLYELDTRLRPEGTSGPLTAPIQAFQQYFASRAALWEGQALSKARPITGPETKPFMEAATATWRRFGVADNLFKDVRTMLDKIHKHRGNGNNPLNIKANCGGIMDIELVVEAHQMKAGVWNNNTLQALDDLSTQTIIPAEEAKVLERAYRLYRHLLFVLRRQENRCVDIIPDSPSEQAKLARHLAFPSGPALMTALEEIRVQAAGACAQLLN